ncbi:hypothetical protein Pla111_02140 [Botrimarina hoheduenensis]|uniref:Uncharacterized protein n=1 Tax=Botrimarina hoheduenensis TaxID=2528000 RepID=A0A5C5WC13_9BACT|nr:hypothetical protein Pla111_02140 [Botrimarina hoheduenensis]
MAHNSGTAEEMGQKGWGKSLSGLLAAAAGAARRVAPARFFGPAQQKGAFLAAVKGLGTHHRRRYPFANQR